LTLKNKNVKHASYQVLTAFTNSFIELVNGPLKAGRPIGSSYFSDDKNLQNYGKHAYP
jgi:hypothetical protein